MKKLLSWLPDVYLAKLWVLLVLYSFIFWAFMLISLFDKGFLDILISVIFSVILGVTYGSFGTTICVVLINLLKRFDKTESVPLSLSRVVKVSLFIYLVHLAGVGILSWLGAWKEPWPWYFGVFPQLL